jgi:hypothetical protein
MRKRLVFLFIFLAIEFSYSQEHGNNVKIGIGSRVAFSLVDMVVEEKLSLSSAIGVVAKIPVASIISLNFELNFAKREFPIEFYSGGCAVSYPVSIEEFAISVPMLIQLMPFGGPTFYLESGLQLDFPIATKMYETDSKNNVSEVYYYTRASNDKNFVLGLGWNIGKHSAFGLRTVWGLESVVKEEEIINISFGLSFSYFF